MKTKALRKDFYVEIKKSITRFLSIFFIVALGVAFFSGIRSTDPDMRITADDYYDNSDLMDFRVLSTLGITEDDITALSQLTDVEVVEPSHSTHVVSEIEGNDYVLEVMSATEKTNRIHIIEGRMPQAENEVLVDELLINSTKLAIGDEIRVSTGTDRDLSDVLKENTFTIVGIGSSAYYMSFERGNSTIGNGEVDSFVAVKPEVFVSDIYSQAYIIAKDTGAMTAYTTEYDDRVDEVKQKLQDLSKERAQIRYQEIYEETNQQIEDANKQLEEKKAEAEQKLNDTLTYIEMTPMDEIQRSAAMTEYEKAKEEAAIEFQKAEADINTAKDELNKLKQPKWYVLDRNTIATYAEYGQNADRIGAIGEVFPAIFFLVATLISLTTMTRMVEEERTQIGTLKALGYSKTSIAMKYILYAFLATFFGSILGFLIGEQLFPRVIITAYKILYRNIPKVVSPFNAYYAALATTLAILCVGLATYLSCYKELLSKPSQLMRPVAPKNGKRVILERLPFLWKRLSFSQKATIRNLLRYKKRFFMTVFGIGACMALLLVGFGLKDSIFVIYDRQFDEIMLYDASVSVEQEATESQQEQLKSILEDHSEINSFLKIKQGTIDISYQGVAKNINYIIPADPKKFQNYVVMRNRVSHTSYNLEEDGVMLTEQVAKQLDIHAGDTLIIEDGDHNKVEVTVRSITENYMSHYLYMTPKLYEKLFKKDLEYNGYLLTMKNVNQEKQYQIGEDLLNVDGVSSIFYVSKLSERLENILSSLNIVVVVLTISAGALAFVVLYNLNNINIKERRRELATIKLLGFYNSELAFYVYRENILLTIIGSFVGAFLGWLLHQYVITTVEIDQVMFGRNIDISSYLYGILLTFLFSIFVNLVMFYKLKKIDMVESLKSVE